MMRHLRRLGDHFVISLPPDRKGYIGRQCPNRKCRKYFKIVNGTGLRGVTVCHCPYCGYRANQGDFHTPDQVEYVQSLAVREARDAIVKDLKELEFEIKPEGLFGLGLSMKVEADPPPPIRHYSEKTLETRVTCGNCTLKYAIYGVFAYCPDCGLHNSLQILDMNLEVVDKMLTAAVGLDREVGAKLIENALEDCVSAFDGYGRELCRINAKKATDPTKAKRISFQNLPGARDKILTLFAFDLSKGVSSAEWNLAARGFQKRHLIAHKMGVVDADYIAKTGDATTSVGRKLVVSEAYVRAVSQAVRKLAQYLTDHIAGLGVQGPMK